MRRLVLAFALLHAACGDDSTSASAGAGGASTSLEASTSSGEGGAGAGGCDPSAPVACDAGHTSAVTAGPTTSATSATGGGGAGEGGASAGTGGAGGDAPVCVAAACAFSDDADDTINCREDCGAIDGRCAALQCAEGPDGLPALVHGVTEILTPPLVDPIDACAAACDGSVAWSARFAIPTDLVTGVDGPSDALIDVEPYAFDPLRTICEAPAAADGCAVLESGTGLYVTIGIDSAHAVAGARFRIVTAILGGPNPDDEPAPTCAGGCNGTGG